jgi:hypothetical protein
MTMRKALIPAVVLAVLLLPEPAAAWGFEAHRYIAARVVALLPTEIRPYFEKHKDVYIERSIDPDLWRNAGYDIESPHHFVDMDAYGPHPFKDLPHDYDAAVKKHGIDFVRKNGTLPWRTEEMFKKLVEAFTQKAGYSRDNIKYYASWVTHYASDAHVPFHASLNHDGQLTKQWGIHSRFETEAFERFREKLTVTPGPLVTVKDSRAFMFETLTNSFTYVQTILDADLEAVKGREFYDDGYFTLFFSKAQPIIEKRLADSITDTASLITAAWIEAGRPALPLESPRVPRAVRRQ